MGNFGATIDDNYSALSGYLAAFIELQYEERMTERDINLQGGNEAPLFISLVLKQGRQVLQWEPFPAAEIERLTGIWFREETQCREWLERTLNELDLLTLPQDGVGFRMYVSLRDLLRAGVFARIIRPATIEQIVELIGEPDASGGTSRKHRRPRIYLYGSVELYVSQANPSTYMGAFWDAEAKGEFRFSSHLEVLDWEWKPGMSREQVEAALAELGLAFEYVHQEIAERQWLRVESGVNVSFDEKGRLTSVSTVS